MSGAPSGNTNERVIRRGAEGDVATVTRVVNAAFDVERFFLGADRVDAGEVRARMQRGAFLLLEDSGALAGCVYVELRGASGFIGLLSVGPQRQKSGLSRALMTAAEECFRGNGCVACELRFVNLRTDLPAYYRRLGYSEAGTEAFPAEISTILPCHLIIMSKPLNRLPAGPGEGI